MLKRLTLLTLFLVCSLRGEQYQLSIFTVFRDEAPYLKEWIEFHRIVGVEHFYLVNHMSVDHFQEVLAPYIEAGIVELDHCYVDIETNHWNSLQQRLCREKIDEVKEETKWLAVIDVDEFLFPVHGDNLVEFLQNYQAYSGLCVNWLMYGTSHIEKLEEGELQTERFILRSKVNYHENRKVKSIVKPKDVDTNSPSKSIHFFHYKEGKFAVDENGNLHTGRESQKVNVKKIRINHYWTRDKHYFYTNKVPSRIERHPKSVKLQREKAMDREKNSNALEDTLIWRFLPLLKGNCEKSIAAY